MWEYYQLETVWEKGIMTPGTLLAMKELGGQGWELVSILDRVAIFKRKNLYA